eukprot:GHVN01071405.1.p1 GENE.GHVN01071405.1~~GHVN01071405.1.p1  ORF type:complete len:101 (+),score=35.81 GHVN01071405.1:149-451(+)
MAQTPTPHSTHIILSPHSTHTNSSPLSTHTSIPRLLLPSENADRWSAISSTLSRPITSLSEIDLILTHFAVGLTNQKCTFFKTHSYSPSLFEFDWNGLYS